MILIIPGRCSCRVLHEGTIKECFYELAYDLARSVSCVYYHVKMQSLFRAQMGLGDINAVLHAAHEIYVSFGRDEHWRISITKCVFNVEGRCAKQLTFGGINTIAVSADIKLPYPA